MRLRPGLVISGVLLCAALGVAEEGPDATEYAYVVNDLTASIEEIPYDDVEGFAIFGGDVNLGRTSDIKRFNDEVRAAGGPARYLEAQKIAGAELFSADLEVRGQLYPPRWHRRWRNGWIPYEIGRVAQAEYGDTIAEMMEAWSKAGVRFERATQNDRRRLLIRAVSGNTSSYTPSTDVIEIGFEGSIGHELGHALGLFHEHQRCDRDKYVSVIWKNVPAGSTGQYTPLKAPRPCGEYDFRSVMHYSRSSKITPKPGHKILKVDNELSEGDLRTLRVYYGNATCPVTPTCP